MTLSQNSGLDSGFAFPPPSWSSSAESVGDNSWFWACIPSGDRVLSSSGILSSESYINWVHEKEMWELLL